MTQLDLGGLNLDAWSLWWQLNQERYLTLAPGSTRPVSPGRSGGDGLEARAPSRGLIFERVVPALQAQLDDEPSRMFQSALLMALARIGEADVDELGDSELAETLCTALASPNRSVAETACISLGVLGRPASVSILSDLLHDTERGRALLGRGDVSVRMRAFAAYGLGLTGQRSQNPDVRRFATHALVSALDQEPGASADDRVACVIALGMIPPAGRDGSGACACASNDALAQRLIEVLADTQEDRLVRAHLPTALARLAEHTTAERTEEIVKLLIDVLGSSKERDLVRQGSALALGLLGDSDASEQDTHIRAALTEAALEGNRLLRSYAYLALGQTGGRKGQDPEDPWAGRAAVQSFLLERLARAKTYEESWATLALGVFGRSLLDDRAIPSSEQLTALQSRLKEASSPDDKAVASIASGLCRDPDGTALLLEELARIPTQEMGLVALGLGMNGTPEAIEPLQAALDAARHQPETLEKISIALQLLGDPTAVPSLTSLLDQCNCSTSRRAVAIALGRTRDARAAEPLLAMLEDSDRPASERATAAIGLALLAEKDPHPWGARISTDLHYRANPASLLGPSRSGILDLP